MGKKGLLDEIAECTNAYCLSDLHTIEYQWDVYSAAMKLKPSDYTTLEWKQAVAYILLEPLMEFENQGVARQYLLMRLKD